MIVVKRIFFITTILLIAYLIFFNFSLLYLQYLGVSLLLFDPFANLFSEISWVEFAIQTMILLFLFVYLIIKLWRTYNHDKKRKKEIKQKNL